MEFVKNNRKSHDKGTIYMCVFLVLMSSISIPIAMRSISEMNNHNFNMIKCVVLTLVIVILEILLMTFGMIDTQRKVIVKNNSLSFYNKRPWGYKLVRTVDINRITAILQRNVSGNVAGTFVNSASRAFTGRMTGIELADESSFYIVDQNNKKICRLDMQNSSEEFYRNQDRQTLLEYLTNEFNLEIKPESISSTVTEVALKIVVGFLGSLLLLAGVMYILINYL